MRVFVTGATGFIGTRVVSELIGAGYQVLGMTRREDGAQALEAAGAEPYRADLGDLDAIRKGAEQNDAVIHLAFNHDFSRMAANCEDDRKVIETLGAALEGTKKKLVVTSGTGIVRGEAGGPSTEKDAPVSSSVIPRAAGEEAVDRVAAKGVHVSVVRLPQVHDPRKQGLIPYVTAVARQKGVSVYIGEGRNRWPAAPVDDVAHLYRLVLEKGAAGARYHAVAEEGVSMREIAEVIGRGLKVPVKSITPEEAPAHFGWLAMFAGHDLVTSGEWTKEQLGWNPTGPSLIEDLERMDYSQA
jgi:nucleoside-diphosphate-sugar epimerase